MHVSQHSGRCARTARLVLRLIHRQRPHRGRCTFLSAGKTGPSILSRGLRSCRPRRRDDRQAQSADGAEPAPLALHRTGSSQPTAAEMGLMPLEGLVDEAPAAEDGPIGEVAHPAAQQCRLWQFPVNPRDGCDLRSDGLSPTRALTPPNPATPRSVRRAVHMRPYPARTAKGSAQ
jgi:hypothetical protein